jgi:acyl dehydratase
MTAPQVLPVVRRSVTQDAIRAYAEASGDFNPVHLDEAFSAGTPFGGIVAHGMWVLAAVSEMMACGLGSPWLNSGSLKVRFKGPARPGDELETAGELKAVETDGRGQVAVYTVRCTNQQGDDLITGTATAVIAPSPSQGAGKD